MDAGTYNYSFQFTVPPDAATTLKSEYWLVDLAFIQYNACVHFDTPTIPDQKFNLSFNVVHPLDLNNFPELRVFNCSLSIRIFSNNNIINYNYHL